MEANSSDNRIIGVYGPTGYTGQLVVAELQRLGLPFMMIGRDEKRLRHLKVKLSLPQVQIKQAAADDPSSLRRAFKHCSVVISCVGPFMKLGEPVLQAAIESGAHYLDTTGEQPFIKLGFDNYDSAARSAGTAAVSAMAFDYAPGDMLSHLAAQGMEPVEEIVIAYAVDGFAISRGTAKTSILMMGSDAIEYSDGHWHKSGFGSLRATFKFPDPIGTKGVTRYPSGEMLSVPRHVKTRKITSLITNETLAPHPALASIVPLGAPGLSLAMRTPLKSVVSKVLDQLPEGPDQQDRKRSKFTIVATAEDQKGKHRMAVGSGSDPYGLTAKIIVHAAELMADPAYNHSGVLAPSSAFDAKAFMDYLKRQAGLIYKVGPAKREG